MTYVDCLLIKEKWKMKKILPLAIIGLACIFTGTAWAGSETGTKETGKAATNPALSNIGFMKKPPKELKEKFPICDAFLNVDWINPDKKIGYSHYEAIVRGQKKLVWALVTLQGDMPCFSWDIYQYVRQGRRDEIFEMIRYGDIGGNLGVLIFKYKGKSAKVFPLFLSGDSLADNKLTICIPYPDAHRVWIAEGKTVGKTHTEEQRKELYAKLKEAGRSYTEERFNGLWILDINFDGKEDYVSESSFVVSSTNRLISAESVYKPPHYELVFPPTGRSCFISRFGKSPLTTDGKAYYFNNRCNVTELISNTRKE